MNKKFIVCEGLRVRLNLVFSLVLAYPPHPHPPTTLRGELTSLSLYSSTGYDAVCFRK